MQEFPEKGQSPDEEASKQQGDALKLCLLCIGAFKGTYIFATNSLDCQRLGDF